MESPKPPEEQSPEQPSQPLGYTTPVPDDTTGPSIHTLGQDELKPEPVVTSSIESPHPTDNSDGTEPSFVRAHLRIILAGSGVILILILIGLAFLLLRPNKSNPPSGSSSTSTPSSVAIQDLTPDQLKAVSAGLNLPSTKQTLTISPNTVFGNDVTVTKTLHAGLIEARDLSLSGPVTLQSANISNNLFVTGQTIMQGAVDIRSQLTVTGALTAASANIGGNLSVVGSITGGSLSVGDASVRNLTVSGTITVGGHMLTSGGAPRVVVGPGATSGSVSISGNDTSGSVTINSGSGSAAGGGTLATVTFTTAFAKQPTILLTPVGIYSGKLDYFIERTTTGFTIESASQVPGSVSLTYGYLVIQ